MTEIYPIGLIIEGEACVVIGGGTIAERKADALLQAQGHVTVVAPRVTDRLAELASEGRIAWLEREAVDADLADAFLAIIATDDPELNSRIASIALKAGRLVNAVDQPDDCNFHVPASVRRGPLTLTISTGGTSPALAKRTRKELQARFGPEYGELCELLGRLRPLAAELIGKQAERAAAWERILDSPVLELLRQGRAEEAEAHARSILESAADRKTT